MAETLKFRRRSFDEMMKELKEEGPTARGVIAIYLRADGSAHFRISGFGGASDVFTAAGLVEWVKADIINDLLS